VGEFNRGGALRRHLAGAAPRRDAGRAHDKVANADQFGLAASPTRRAMTMAGNSTPRVDRKVASILAELLTA